MGRTCASAPTATRMHWCSSRWGGRRWPEVGEVRGFPGLRIETWGTRDIWLRWFVVSHPRSTTPATKTCRWGPRERNREDGHGTLFENAASIPGLRIETGGTRDIWLREFVVSQPRSTTPATKTCRWGPRERNREDGARKFV